MVRRDMKYREKVLMGNVLLLFVGMVVVIDELLHNEIIFKVRDVLDISHGLSWKWMGVEPSTNGRNYWVAGVDQPRDVRKKNPIMVCNTSPKMYGDWPICMDYHSDQPPNCVVLSFGINREWMLEDAWATHGCVVHAFDPTTHLQAVHENHASKHGISNIIFHYAGLRGAENTKFGGLGNTNDPNYLGGPLYDLKTFLNKYTEEGAVEHLKIDVEGYEWETFALVAKNDNGKCKTLAKVKEMCLELHFGSFNGLSAPSADIVSEVLYYLYRICSFRNWYLHTKGVLAWKDGRANPPRSDMQIEVEKLGFNPYLENINVCIVK